MIHPRLCNARPDFYPRSPCGERLFLLRKITITVDISIHALLAESDFFWLRLGTRVSDFYPRSPCGERRLFFMIFNLIWSISIHALLAESDCAWSASKLGGMSISIHALLAESDYLATWQSCDVCISIHALLAESDH